MKIQITLTLTANELTELIDTLDKRAEFFFARLESIDRRGVAPVEVEDLLKRNLAVAESLLSKVRAAESLALMQDERAA